VTKDYLDQQVQLERLDQLALLQQSLDLLVHKVQPVQPAQQDRLARLALPLL
jgi:hypothetical protein